MDCWFILLDAYCRLALCDDDVDGVLRSRDVDEDAVADADVDGLWKSRFVTVDGMFESLAATMDPDGTLRCDPMVDGTVRSCEVVGELISAANGRLFAAWGVWLNPLPTLLWLYGVDGVLG